MYHYHLEIKENNNADFFNFAKQMKIVENGQPFSIDTINLSLVFFKMAHLKL